MRIERKTITELKVSERSSERGHRVTAENDAHSSVRDKDLNSKMRLNFTLIIQLGGSCDFSASCVPIQRLNKCEI